MFGYQICFVIGLIACILATEAKIVYLNGTEISGEQGFTTLSAPVTNVMPNSVSNPQIINNHSGNKTKIEELSFFRRKDAEQTAGTGKNSSSGTITIRDTTVLTNLRGIFTDLKPTITILSTILGLFFIFILIESPLSPLPVPPLPYPPIGPFPPTNIYPYGVLPIRNHYSIQYAGPPRYDSYRIPRHMKTLNGTVELENLVEKVIDRVVPDIFNYINGPEVETVLHNVAVGIKSITSHFSSIEDSSENI